MRDSRLGGRALSSNASLEQLEGWLPPSLLGHRPWMVNRLLRSGGGGETPVL
jgi:hypothetical protein